jgi:hypothetical protein
VTANESVPRYSVHSCLFVAGPPLLMTAGSEISPTLPLSQLILVGKLINLIVESYKTEDNVAAGKL